jgi:type IV pilus assembly protein PilA
MRTSSKTSTSNERGFTLIELLVVVLIIGILAAIAIPSFLNQRQKGQDACAKSLARTMQTAMETFYVERGTYSGADPSALNAIESAIPTNNTSPCSASWDVVYTGSQAAGSNCNGNSPGANNYCIFVPSVANGFRIYRTNTGQITRTCVYAGQGACSSAGTW